MFNSRPHNSAHLAESIDDYRQDFEELHVLLTDCVNRLKRFLADIRRVKKHIAPETYEEMTKTADCYIEACRAQDSIVKKHSDIILHAPDNTESLDTAEKINKSAYEFLRTHQTLFGALITSTDWQSPSFAHSLHSQAGRQTNTIYATINDYKRDQHWDAHRYELAFLKANIDGFIKFPIQVCATPSGMAAFTTILNFLLLERKATRPVLIGKSIYFENKALVLQAFPDNVIEVEESDTDAVIRAIDSYNPSVVIFDSLSNSPDVAVPNLTAITKHLVAGCKSETFLVVDNTCLSVMFQPFPFVFAKHSKLRLIVFESLNKYHQFGYDRVTGGIFWSYGGDTGKLFDYRVHLGTNIPDLAIASLPTPNRKTLIKHLAKHQRNAMIVAFALQAWIDTHPQAPFSGIMYPGLSHHPSYNWTKNNTFCGSYLTIQFKKKYQTIPSYKRFVRAIIQKARRNHVDIVSGTSFGMNTTRVYLTAVRSRPHIPFIRVSVGTETRMAIEAVTQVCIETLSSFR